MQYIFRKSKNTKAHIWNDSDTYCTMWSTGGLKKTGDWVKENSPKGRGVCTMCQSNYEKSTSKVDQRQDCLQELLDLLTRHNAKLTTGNDTDPYLSFNIDGDELDLGDSIG